jgi:hypothetical protein
MEIVRMSRYTVLQLESWCLNEEIFNKCIKQSNRVKIGPIFNRNGRYYDRIYGFYWVETEFGSVLISSQYFKWDLKTCDELDILPKKAEQEFNDILNSYYVPSSIKHEIKLKLLHNSHMKDLRNISRDIRRFDRLKSVQRMCE